MLRVARALLVASCAALSACTLLIDTDALTNGRGGAGGSGGGTPGAGASGSGFDCVPSDVDAYCDGLDAQCRPTLQEICPAGCTGSTLSGVSYMGCVSTATFNDAEISCQAQRMHLVAIDSASENTFVVQLAQSLGSYVWIGGSDLQQNSTFAWTDGTPFYAGNAALPGVYQNFATGEPALDAARHCVHLHDDPPGYWFTTSCTNREQFICERY